MKVQNPIHILIGIVCIGFLPTAQAVVPPPDGGYPGGNTAEGESALLHLTTGTYNTALGFLALRRNTEGQFNTGVGAGTLLFNRGDQSAEEGVQNTAIGAAALLKNTTGSFNTATGVSALLSNTSGGGNTATGVDALFSNSTGVSNTATGDQALESNTTGGFNTATGVSALFNNTTGSANTASGVDALLSNTTGDSNTASGDAALFNNTAGIGNTALGFGAGSGVTTASNVICIGANVIGANVSNSCFVGNIREVTTAMGDAIPVVIDSAGQLGTTSSSQRFKKEIQPMDQASEAILALKPVTFRYKSDNTATTQFGLIAEEVAAVNPELVVRDEKGEIYTVRYDAVNAMLLNEFLKQHRKIEQQERKIQEQDYRVREQGATISAMQSTVTQQQKGIEVLTAQLRQQATQIQRVSAQLEISKRAPQVVNNNE
jgi:uncharacterized coiled-coil protein SlyX